jgi:hypothetical protein
MNVLRNCATFLFLLLLIGCGQSEPTMPTAVSQTTPTATVLPTITAVPATATFTPTPLPTATFTPLPTATSTPPPTPVRAGPTVTPIAVGNAVGFELVAQVGGAINSFAISGDHILAGQGPRLVVLGASDLANLNPISQSDVLPGIVSNIMVRGETAVFTAGHLLMVWDISDPTQPVMAHSLALPAAGSLLWQDDIIYATGLIASQHVEQEDGSGSQYFESYVATVDVSGPPRLLHQITLPYYLTATALVGEILYLGLSNQPAQSVLGVDVSNPSQLSDPIPIPLPIEIAFSLRTYGNILLVGGYYELATFDVTDPRQPHILWREEGWEIGQVHDFAVWNGQVHTLGWQAAGAFISTQAAIDLPQPLPEPTTLTPAGRQLRRTLGIGLTVVDDHLFQLWGTSLTLWHLEQETQTVIGEYTPPGGGHPAIMDEVVYVGLEAGYVDSYRLTDLTPLDRYTLPHEETAEFIPAIYSLTAADGRLYLTRQRQFHILDAASLTPLGQFISAENDPVNYLWQQTWRFYAPPIVDNRAYVYALSHGASSEFVVPLDITDPETIQELDGRIRPFPDQPSVQVAKAAATENWLILSLRGPVADYLNFYDMETAVPDLVAAMSVDIAPTAMQVRGDLLVVGGGGTFRDDGFLQIYRLPDETPLATLQLPGVHDLYLLDDLLLLTTETGRLLLAYDLSDPANPQAVGAFSLPYHWGRLAVSGDYVVVADQMMGLYLLRLER